MTDKHDECRPPPDRAVCAVRPCTYAEGGDDFAAAGRRALETELLAHQLSPHDAYLAANHVSDRVVTLALLGKVVVTDLSVCNRCGGQQPQFAEAPGLTDNAYQRGCCPYHPDGRAWSGRPGENVPS